MSLISIFFKFFPHVSAWYCSTNCYHLFFSIGLSCLCLLLLTASVIDNKPYLLWPFGNKLTSNASVSLLYLIQCPFTCSGAEKLCISDEHIVAVDEADGTEIDDIEMAVEMKMVIILLKPGQTWMKVPVDTPDQRAGKTVWSTPERFEAVYRARRFTSVWL